MNLRRAGFLIALFGLVLGMACAAPMLFSGLLDPADDAVGGRTLYWYGIGLGALLILVGFVLALVKGAPTDRHPLP